MATTAGSAAQPKWMPGHLNRETRRLRLSRGGGAWESPFGPFIVRRFRLPFFQSSFLRVPSIYTTLARILDIKPKPDHCRSIESSIRARCNTRLSTRNVDLTFFFFFFVSFFSSSRRFHASRNLVDAVLKKSYVSFFFHFFFFVSRCTFPSNWIHLAWKINWPERSSSYKFITGSFRYDE